MQRQFERKRAKKHEKYFCLLTIYLEGIGKGFARRQKKESTKNRFHPSWIHIHVRWVYIRSASFSVWSSTCACVCSARRPFTSQMVLRCRYRHVQVWMCVRLKLFNWKRKNEWRWVKGGVQSEKTLPFFRLAIRIRKEIRRSSGKKEMIEKLVVMTNVGGSLHCNWIIYSIGVHWWATMTTSQRQRNSQWLPFVWNARFAFDVHNQMRM